MINLVIDGIVILTLMVWLFFMVRVHIRLKLVLQAGQEQERLMKEFTDTIIAGQRAARSLSENLSRAHLMLEEEQKKARRLVIEMQEARDQFRRELARHRQGLIQ